MLMVARLLVPMMGLGGIENEWLSPLSRLMPFAAMAVTTSIVLLVLSFRWQVKPVYPEATRLVDEAEKWSERFVIGEELERASAFVPQIEDSGDPATQTSFASLPISSTARMETAIEPEPCTEPDFAVATATQPHTNATFAAWKSPHIAFDDTGQQSKPETADTADQNMNHVLTESVASLNGSPATLANSFNQLPPSLPEFAGRLFELAELMAARSNPENKVLSLQGLGGVGKTTLALKLAHQLAPHYPDAQFFVDLKGASPKPLSVAEAQSHIIRVYMPAARLPENESELGKLYQSVLSGKRALLLFDNAQYTAGRAAGGRQWLSADCHFAPAFVFAGNVLQPVGQPARV